MALKFGLCCLSLPQIYRKSRDTFYCLIQDSSYVISENSAHFGMTFAYFWFELKETNRTKILRKLWCARLQIRVESVEGEKGIYTYPPAFFLPLVFETSSQSLIEYSTVTFGFDPCALLKSGYCNRTGSILVGACSDINIYFMHNETVDSYKCWLVYVWC